MEYDLRVPELQMLFIPLQEHKQINGHNGKQKTKPAFFSMCNELWLEKDLKT